jgi:hypothetical protein
MALNYWADLAVEIQCDMCSHILSPVPSDAVRIDRDDYTESIEAFVHSNLVRADMESNANEDGWIIRGKSHVCPKCIVKDIALTNVKE